MSNQICNSLRPKEPTRLTQPPAPHQRGASACATASRERGRALRTRVANGAEVGNRSCNLRLLKLRGNGSQPRAAVLISTTYSGVNSQATGGQLCGQSRRQHGACVCHIFLARLHRQSPGNAWRGTRALSHTAHQPPSHGTVSCQSRSACVCCIGCGARKTSFAHAATSKSSSPHSDARRSRAPRLPRPPLRLRPEARPMRPRPNAPSTTRAR